MSDGDESEEGSGFSWGLTPSGPEKRDREPPTLVEPPRVSSPQEPEDTQPMDRVDDPAPLPGPEPPPEPLPQPTSEPPPEPLPQPTSAPPPEPIFTAIPADPPPSALDTLFGDSNFQEYDDDGITPGTAPSAPGRRVAARSPSPGPSTAQKVMIWIVGGLVALLALTALFFLGTRLPDILAKPVAVVTPTHTPMPTPTPTATAPTTGPVAAGVHAWDALRGGECLDPYTGPWAETFTVVDCAAAHPAQLVFRGTFDTSKIPTFPGTDALQQQIALLCAAPGVIDLGAAGQYTDAQLQGSYPVTAAQWDAGEHDYFCFVSRSSGQPLTGSVAAARP